jgi:hypothetical protein
MIFAHAFVDISAYAYPIALAVGMMIGATMGFIIKP